MVSLITASSGRGRKMRKIIIDGMLSGTGIRDAVAGGYMNPNILGLSEEAKRKLSDWLSRYENAHYYQYEDKVESQKLDLDGIELAKSIGRELPDCEVAYYSSAQMKKLPIM